MYSGMAVGVFIMLAGIIMGFLMGRAYQREQEDADIDYDGPEPSHAEKVESWDQFYDRVTFRHADGSCHYVTVRKSPESIARQGDKWGRHPENV